MVGILLVTQPSGLRALFGVERDTPPPSPVGIAIATAAAVLGGLGGVLQKVIINRVEEDTYFAELIIQRDGDVISIDARPSDAIALALRTQAEIFVDDELIGLMAMETSEDASFATPDQMQSGVDSAEELAADDLKEYLRKLAPEDFGRFTP